MGMTFNVGKHKLEDGTLITTPHTSLIAGDAVVKNGTETLPNGVYRTPTKEITVHEGKITKVEDPKPKTDEPAAAPGSEDKA